MRLRAEYSVGVNLKFLANLDMMHLMERTLRRAQIPYLLSEGYNPHIKLSMGTVLPVGVWGTREYFDLELEEISIEEFVERMNNTLPPGMFIYNCRELPVNAPSLMKIINAAEYAFLIKQTSIELNNTASAILDEEQILVQSRGKNKNLQKDLRPGIYRIDVEKQENDELFCIMVSINEPVNVRFDELLDAFIRYGINKDLIIDFWRRGNYIKEGCNFYSPLEKVK